jgi:hypothetical protein
MMGFLFLASILTFANSNVNQCLQNPIGIKNGLKISLNSYADPDSQRLGDLKWPEFCQCYMSALESRPKSKGNLPDEEYKKQANEMELKSIECVKKAGFNPAKPQPQFSPLIKNEFFEEKINFCETNGIGRTIIIESELSVMKDSRVAKVRSMSLPQYCRCYYEQLRHRVGDEKAKLMANFETHKAKPEDMLFLKEQNKQVTEFCVGKQIPYPKEKESSKLTQIVKLVKKPELTPFDKIIKSQFTIGEGLGEIKIGTSTESLNQFMGPIGVKTPRNEFDEYRYGSNLTELIVRTAPPGKNGKVIYVKVDYTFRGPISKGIKMGEMFESVIEKMKPWVPYSTDRNIGHLMYKEGAQFSFSDYNGGVLQGLIAFDPATHPLLKMRAK